MSQKRMVGEERSRAILAAALDLFAHKSDRGVTTAEIARAAGVSEALVFKHFPDKESLYRAILEDTIHEAESALPFDAALRTLDDEAFFHRLAASILSRVEADDRFLRLLLASALEGHDLARKFHRARVEKLLAAIEERLRSRGLPHPGGVDPALAARAFHGMIFAALLARHVFREPVAAATSVDAWAATLARIFLHGIGVSEA